MNDWRLWAGLLWLLNTALALLYILALYPSSAWDMRTCGGLLDGRWVVVWCRW